ncbi:Glutathione S-transferase 1 [Holothuria leucospilota]|uniref:Glutathione S-transferase 1 n=1 Tax=Holothuria leucospilota TaxID=206669 RepID=A0A9Q0YI80_HOLLE|nr:Glutathione S-transferase 1 [Holothuria leucospilota]
MVVFKLTYFDVRGRAEPIRYLFALAGVEYEDKRLTSEEWKKLKPNTPFGGLPILEVDGKVLGQTQAICRHVAYMHGFFPENAWDRAQADAICEKQLEFMVAIQRAKFESDPAKKETMAKKLKEEDSKTHLTQLQNALKQNNGGKGWFIGNKISLADVQVFFVLHDQYPAFLGDAVGVVNYLDGFDLLKGFVVRFKAEPKVAEWLKKRPVNSF